MSRLTFWIAFQFRRSPSPKSHSPDVQAVRSDEAAQALGELLRAARAVEERQHLHDVAERHDAGAVDQPRGLRRVLRGPGVREHQGDRAIEVADQVEALLAPAPSSSRRRNSRIMPSLSEFMMTRWIAVSLIRPAGVGVLVDLAAQERTWGVVQLGRQLGRKGAVGQARGQAVRRRAGVRRSATSAAAACC